MVAKNNVLGAPPVLILFWTDVCSCCRFRLDLNSQTLRRHRTDPRRTLEFFFVGNPKTTSYAPLTGIFLIVISGDYFSSLEAPEIHMCI